VGKFNIIYLKPNNNVNLLVKLRKIMISVIFHCMN